MLKPLLILVATLAGTPALAGATPWQDIAPGTRARLITSDVVANGKTLVGLELDMPAGTKTYWRIPGEIGIPTEFGFAGSSGIGATKVLWPYPEIDHARGYLDYVYHGHIVLPVEVTTDGGAGALKASVTLGVCSDICVPAQASFLLSLGYAKADPEQSLRLEMAVADVPADWDQPQMPFGDVAATLDGLTIAGLDSTIDPASIIADLGDPQTLFAAPQKSPDGRLWVLKLLGKPGAEGLVGRTVQLTFRTPMGPYAVFRQIAAAD